MKYELTVTLGVLISVGGIIFGWAKNREPIGKAKTLIELHKLSTEAELAHDETAQLLKDARRNLRFREATEQADQERGAKLLGMTVREMAYFAAAVGCLFLALRLDLPSWGGFLLGLGAVVFCGLALHGTLYTSGKLRDELLDQWEAERKPPPAAPSTNHQEE